VTADFLNNPQRNARVAYRSSGRCDGSCGWRLPRCGPARTLLSKFDPLSWCAGASNGDKGGDRDGVTSQLKDLLDKGLSGSASKKICACERDFFGGR
jgi:hypothetical protein